MSSDVARQRHDYQGAMWAVAAAFGCYFCMYAFRKPFTVGEFRGDENIWGMSFKTLLVTSQILGYTVSKFVGVKVISEMTANQRPRMLLTLIILAELALLLFAVLPRPWNACCLFLNGLPLGMVFGLVLGQLEGRRLTEALTAGLCTSFILADGFCKTVGRWLLDLNVPEHWMPMATGAIFLGPLAFFVYMLAQVKPPDDFDREHRHERVALNRQGRWLLFRQYAWGLLPIIAMYLIVTIVRSIRADFAPELWRGMRVDAPPAIYTTSETWVALIVLLINGAAVLIHNNARAFSVSLGTCLVGGIIMGLAIVGWNKGWISGFWFMVLMGQGLYLPYVAVHTTLFERLLAMTRQPGNIGFLMYLVDSIGYLGYVAVIVLRNSRQDQDHNHVFELFLTWSWICAVATIVCAVATWGYFRFIYHNRLLASSASVERSPFSSETCP